MKFNFKNQTETVQAIIVAVGALVVLGLVWLILNVVADDVQDSKTVNTGSTSATTTATSTNTATTGNLTKTQTPSNTVAVGGYANGTYVGYIRNISKVNGYTFTIDFVEYLTGKEAFLAAAAESASKPQYNWDMMKDRYPTYAQLAKGIRALTDIELEALYASYATKAGDNKSGILTAFPNGFVYIRNNGTAVRVIPSDTQLGSASVSNGSIQIAMDDLYLICHNPTPAILDMYYRKYQAGVTCENVARFTISKGKVTSVKIIYQP